eukprot:GHRR01021065.1.p2 GENE.GHRR01021065.1~~GHRR01021065.1.p2  ORF type:complete len:155 (+),score=23.48 GHRR01021065.1:1771-2235(+)
MMGKNAEYSLSCHSLGHEQIHCCNCLVVIIEPHVEGLDVLGVIRHNERGLAEHHLTQVPGKTKGDTQSDDRRQNLYLYISILHHPQDAGRSNSCSYTVQQPDHAGAASVALCLLHAATWLLPPWLLLLFSCTAAPCCAATICPPFMLALQVNSP